MTVEQVIESVEQLSDNEKLAVIEAISQMMQRSLFAPPLSVAGRKVMVKPKGLRTSLSDDPQSEQESVEKIVPEKSDSLTAMLVELGNRPNPTPEQMLPYGLFKGMNFTEEDFRAAEWHPTDEEMDGE